MESVRSGVSVSWHLGSLHPGALSSLGHLGMELYGSVLEATLVTFWHSVGQDLVTRPRLKAEEAGDIASSVSWRKGLRKKQALSATPF